MVPPHPTPLRFHQTNNFTTSNNDHNDGRSLSPVSPLQSATFPGPLSFLRSRHVFAVSGLDGDNDFTTGPVMSRPESPASDRISVVSGLTQHFSSNPLKVSPAPAYVARVGAAQVLSEHRSSITGARLSDDEDEGDRSPGKEDMTFSEPALGLVNTFLDQLLYSFLSSARSTSLVALRPAVTEVLRQRLAREAIASAEEELAELLAGGDDEEDVDNKHQAAENARNWDLELVWKRTRLRVMVYIRLGEMEDDDEQRFVQEEELFHNDERRFSSTSGLVSWAAAIFLTSVLEYVAEQTLRVAGSAAHARARRQMRSAGTQQADGTVLVEEHDVEKVALNSTLGRLWRTWRKSLRNYPGGGMVNLTADRSPDDHTSQNNMYTAMPKGRRSFEDGPESAGVSRAEEGSAAASVDPQHDDPDLQYPEHVLAADIPLPMSLPQRDVHEIEVPGLAADPDVDNHLHEILLSELALATHLPPPFSQRDVHEIETPGLARDVDDSDESQARHADRLFAADLPLPLTDGKRDIDEIEVPGLARDPDAQDEPLPVVTHRRNSFTQYKSVGSLSTPESSRSSSPVAQGRGMVRRSSSVPTPARTPMPREEDVPVLPVAKSEKAVDPPTAGDTESKPERQESNSSSSESQSEEKGENGGIIAGIAAGTTAVGAAAAAAVYGSKENEVAAHEPVVDNAPRAVDGQPQSSKTPAEIEELDKRKSLIDMKSIAGFQKSSPAASGTETPDSASGKRETGTARPEHAGRQSIESYSLGNRHRPPLDRQETEEVPGNSSEEGPQNVEAIGVARTSDVPGSQDARDMQRSTRVLIGEEPPTSPQVKQLRSSTGSANGRPRSFSRKSEVSLTDQNHYVAQQAAQQRASANGYQQPPDGTITPRQPRSLSAEKNTAVLLQSTQGQTVHEHPAVQSMGNLQRGKVPVDDQGSALTSASIRGPADFDMLVHGGETTKYTLTPETVRDDSDKRTPATQLQAQPGAERKIFATSNAEALKQLTAGAADDSRQGRGKLTRETTSSTDTEEEARRKRQHRRSISRPPVANTRALSKTGLMAREPRVQTESTREMADFFRSTGPDTDTDVRPLMKNASQTSLNSMRSAHINGANASKLSSPAASRASSVKNGVGDAESLPPVPRIPTNVTHGNMQPRGANGASPGTSELIDFIRIGPQDEGQHRISRSVAPFRNTMDSEQFRDMDERLSMDRPLDLSLNNRYAPSKRSSQRTSANSRAPLLNGANGAAATPQTAHPAYSGRQQTLAATLPSERSPPQTLPSVESEPTRKRYRNKDPHAIDLSDGDDDDLVTALPENSGRQEQSLAEFLSSAGPPTDNSHPRPLLDPSSAQGRKYIQNARTGSINSTSRGARSAQSTPGPQKPGYASSTISARSNGSRVQPSNNSFMSTSISASNAPRTKMLARGSEKEQRAMTSDLADFLRDSGPPTESDLDSAPAPTVGRAKTGAGGRGREKGRESGKVMGFLGRRGRKGWLDVA